MGAGCRRAIFIMCAFFAEKIVHIQLLLRTNNARSLGGKKKIDDVILGISGQSSTADTGTGVSVRSFQALFAGSQLEY